MEGECWLKKHSKYSNPNKSRQSRTYMYFLSTTCSHGHHHNSFITVVLGHIRVHLMDTVCKCLQVNQLQKRDYADE